MTDERTRLSLAEEETNKKVLFRDEAVLKVLEAIYAVARWAKITVEYNAVEPDDMWMYITPTDRSEISDKEIDSVKVLISHLNYYHDTLCEYTLYCESEEWWFSIDVFPHISFPPEEEE